MNFPRGVDLLLLNSGMDELLDSFELLNTPSLFSCFPGNKGSTGSLLHSTGSYPNE